MKKTNWKKQIENNRPLIHCLTNHITILDCANIALALGARPVMAEHPGEVEEITASAKALVCNLGNISDSRMAAMRRSGSIANKKGIVTVLDMVGIGCSSLRLGFAKEFTAEFHPSIIKGNASEILAFADLKSHAVGIDAGKEDLEGEGAFDRLMKISANLAYEWKCIVVVSGACDILTDGKRSLLVKNGCERMTKVTGTGCMLDVVIACFAGISESEDMLDASAYGTAMYGICGKRAMKNNPSGTGRIRLFDEIEQITDKKILKKMKVDENESI